MGVSAGTVIGSTRSVSVWAADESPAVAEAVEVGSPADLPRSYFAVARPAPTRQTADSPSKTCMTRLRSTFIENPPPGTSQGRSLAGKGTMVAIGLKPTDLKKEDLRDGPTGPGGKKLQPQAFFAWRPFRA